jgi:tRNA G46 methylase TrmB
MGVTSSGDDVRLVPVLLDWWKIRLLSRGLLPTTREFFAELWDFIRESTPERHRQRYGDVGYDWDYRVDTTSATVGFRDRLLGAFSSAYQPTEPEAFRDMLHQLPISFSDFTFIDLGSGKGRTLLMASDFAFRRIIGVELIPTLHKIAEQNVSKYQSPVQKCSHIELICQDARNFVFPPDPLVVYLFNPFPEPILKRVLTNLQESLRHHPRRAYVIYYNPVLEHALQNNGFLLKMTYSEHCAIYVSSTD